MTPDPWKIKEHIQQTFPDELQLLICMCCPDEPDEHIVSELSQNCDWKKFLELTDRHRLLPFLALRKKYFTGHMPASEMSVLNSKLDNHKHSALFKTNEVFRICRLFEQNNISVMPIKGPCLAWQLYNDVTFRLSHDLDFLILEKDIETVKDLMGQSEFRQTKVFSPRQTKYFYSHLTHHYSFYNSQSKILEEMHWRLFLNNKLYPVPTEEIFNCSTTEDIAGNNLKLMNDVALLHYLCLHGCEHFWFRLHWLRDIAQIIHSQKTDLKKCIEKAIGSGIEKPVCESLLLASLVYKINLPGSVHHDIINHCSDWFIRQSLFEIRDVAYELKSRRVNVIINKLRSKFHLRKDFSYRIQIIPFFKTTSTDWEKISLPDPLFFLYRILHPFILLFNRITR